MMLGSALLGELVSALESDRSLAQRLAVALGLGASAPNGELVSLAEAGVPVRSLRVAIRRGELEARRIGRAYYVERSALARWLEARRVAPRPKCEQKVSQPSEAERAIRRATAAGRLRCA